MCAHAAQALKYFQGEKHETYKGAAQARNLLQNDGEWHLALQSASSDSTPRQMRALYLYIVEWNQPEAPIALFDAYWDAMADDLAYEPRCSNILPTDEQLRLRLLLELEETLESNGKQMSDVCGMALSDAQRDEARALAQRAQETREPRIIRDELVAGDERTALQQTNAEQVRRLLPSQKLVYDAVLEALHLGRGRCLFVDAPGGTGKTFTFNAILGAVRCHGEIAIAVASSGIAAILLDKGRTFHARFCANLKPAEDQMLNIKAQSTVAQLLRRAKVVLWDEAAMGNKHHLDALDRSLRDFMQNDEPFGGKIIVLGGDYRQTLPIQRKASRAQTLRITLTQSHLWRHFEVFHLMANMRINRLRDTLDASDNATQHLLEELEDFASWLLRLGNDELETDPRSYVELPAQYCIEDGCDLDALTEFVYPNLVANCTAAPGETATESALRIASWLAHRAILAPHNTDVSEVCAIPKATRST